MPAPSETLESLGPGAAAPAPSAAKGTWFVRFHIQTPEGRFEPDEPQVKVTTVSAERAELTVSASGNGILFAQVARHGEVPLNVALPVYGPTSSQSCGLSLGGSGTSLTADVSLPDSPEVDAVARFLNGGHVQEAARVAGDAEHLLERKMADPFGAALGGYALLRSGQLDRLHHWPRNLADKFPWFPDGAVIAGEEAALEGDNATAIAICLRGGTARAAGLRPRALPARCETPGVLRRARDRLRREREARQGGEHAPRAPARDHAVRRLRARVARVSRRRHRQAGDVSETLHPTCHELARRDGAVGGAMLRIDMLPAAQGDALWIEYGDEHSPKRILIDGGTKGSWKEGLRARIEGLPAADRHFELLIVTHIDADHIDGALKLLQDETLGTSFGDVWFNGWRHLPETLEPLGPVAGERLTDAIVERADFRGTTRSTGKRW